MFVRVVIASMLVTAATASAQVRAPGGVTRSVVGEPSSSVAERDRKTILQFELISDGLLGGGVSAREWGDALQKLDAEVRIRQRTGEDEPGVTEKTRGTLRWVTVVAVLNSTGQIVLPDQTFSLSDTERLREWTDELKLYGAQGAPEGKPLWGLTKLQFSDVFAALAVPVPQELEGETLTAALQRMGLPARYPVRFHTTATRHLSSSELPNVRQRLAGVTGGTALAALLAEYGLGFRPLRTPTGEIELVVQPLTEIRDPWPVGWEPEQGTSRFELVPELLKMVQVQFDDIPLQEVFEDIARTTGRPIIVDRLAAEQHGVDLAETTLSYPLKRTSWLQVIHSASARNRLTETLRIDEGGRAFVHVAPFVPRRRDADKTGR